MKARCKKCKKEIHKDSDYFWAIGVCYFCTECKDKIYSGEERYEEGDDDD